MPAAGEDGGGKEPVKARNASIGDIAKTVFFAFFGVRKRKQHEVETVHLTPVQIIVAGLVGAVVFVTSLMLLVKFIVGRAAG